MAWGDADPVAKGGWGDDDPIAKPKPGMVKDAAKAALTGFAEGAAPIVDAFIGAGPAGMVQKAAQATGLFKGDVSGLKSFDRTERRVAGVAYQPQTNAGKYARSIAQMAPNVFAPGGLVRRAAQVVLPGVAAEAAGQAAEASGGNALAQGAARFAGGLAGGLGASVRPNRLARPTPDDSAINAFARRAKVSPAEMRANAMARIEAGVEPTLIDVSGDRGRRFIRAVGVKSEMAGERLASNARSVSSSAKPAIMARTQGVGPMRGMTKDQLVEQLFKTRDEAAETDFAPVYATLVKTNETILKALSGAPGRAALQRARQAAVARMDDERVKEIDSLLNHDGPLDMSPAARLGRAKAEGFDPNTPYYHGTGGEFADDLRASEDGAAGPGVYLTESPLEAGNYATIAGMRGEGNPNIRPVVVREGKAEQAVSDPARVVRDPADVRSAFDPFTPEGYRPPPEQVSAATLHRAQIALREKGRAAAKRDAGDLASGYKMRQGMIKKALEDVPELGPANADYKAKSQALGVLGYEGKKANRKDLFSTDPADYGRWLETLPPEAKAANQVAIRQEILDTLGGQRSSTFGSVDELATSEYAKANLAQALGDDAKPYLAFLEAKLEQVRNARMVDPNAGSRTAVLENDLGGVMRGAADVGGKMARGDVGGVVLKAATWLASRGISDQQARVIAEASTDPAKLQGVLQYLENRMGRPAAQEYLLALRGPAMAAATAGTMAGIAPQSQSQQPQN